MTQVRLLPPPGHGNSEHRHTHGEDGIPAHQGGLRGGEQRRDGYLGVGGVQVHRRERHQGKRPTAHLLGRMGTSAEHLIRWEGSPPAQK